MTPARVLRHCASACRKLFLARFAISGARVYGAPRRIHVLYEATMVWQYTPLIWLPLASALISAGLGAYAWRRRQVAGARLFSLSMLTATLWALGYALQMASADLSSAYFWLSAQMLGPVLVPVVWFLMTLQFTGRGHWLRPRLTLALLVIPALSLAFLWLGGLPGPMAHAARMDPLGDILVLHVEPAFWFWVHSAYSYALVATILLLWAHKASLLPPPYRYQPLAFLLAVVTLMCSHALVVAGVIRIRGVNPTTLLSSVTYMIFALGIFRFRLLDVMPIARARVVELMADGLIVLDGQRHLVDLNPAVQHILGLCQSQAISQPAEAILAPWPELIAAALSDGAWQGEMTLSEEPVQAARVYALNAFPLGDQERQALGRMLTLRDVTQERQAVAERERLIAELQAALGRVKTLSGLLPVCAWCGKICDDDGMWSDLDAYITRHSDAEITHGICPECERRVRQQMGS
jgi:PAS domain-containing protein